MFGVWEELGDHKMGVGGDRRTKKAVHAKTGKSVESNCTQKKDMGAWRLCGEEWDNSVIIKSS